MCEDIKEAITSTVQKILLNQPLGKEDFIFLLQTGEDIMKSIAERVRETLEVIAAAAYKVVDILLYPVTWLLEKVDRLLLAFA